MPPTTTTTAGHPILNYIDGSWVASSGTDTLRVEDPTTREVLRRVPLSTPADVDAAVRAAIEADLIVAHLVQARIRHRYQVLPREGEV